MLQEIAETQRFEVNYLDIEETSQSGKFVPALLQIFFRILSILLYWKHNWFGLVYGV